MEPLDVPGTLRELRGMKEQHDEKPRPLVQNRGPIEIEAKFRVMDPEEEAWLLSARRIGGLHAGPANDPLLFVDHYLDTPDRKLLRAGWTLRLRRLDRGTLASLKSIVPPDGALHTRDEIERQARFDPDPTTWRKSEVRERALELLAGEKPSEIARISQWRRNRELEGPEGLRIEMSLDGVVVHAKGRKRASWNELELELLEGEAGALLAVSRKLAKRAGLVPERHSKGERAIRLADRRRNV
jgi:triphosphatase